jgi:5-methylcytosine-specific restriction endonuclease McrA
VVPTDLSEYPTQEEVNEMLLQPCVWCGQSDWHKIGLDRKDNRFGHIRNNIQPCCKRCNEKKGKLSNEEFRQAIAEGRIKLKIVKAVKADADTAAIPAMPSMRSLLI